MDIEKLISINILEYNNKSYLMASIVFFVTLVSYQFLSNLILKKLNSFCAKAEGEKSCLDNVLSKPLSYFILLLGSSISWSLSPFSSATIERGNTVFTTLFVIIVFWLFVRLAESIRPFAQKLVSKIGLGVPDNIVNTLILSLKVLIIAVALLSILQAWGVNVAAFLAGLGLIGIAISFAAQELIKSLFGTLILFIDHTYKKGDHIRIGALLEGTVEAVEIRSTIVKLKEGSIARISNGAILNEPVWNYTQKTYKK